MLTLARTVCVPLLHHLLLSPVCPCLVAFSSYVSNLIRASETFQLALAVVPEEPSRLWAFEKAPALASVTVYQALL